MRFVPSGRFELGRAVATACVVALSAVPVRAADFAWLEEALAKIRNERGPGAQIAVIGADAPDRAGVFIESGGTIEVLLLYKGHTAAPTRVEFRTSTPVPSVASLPPWAGPSGLPPGDNTQVVDRQKTAGVPALRPAAMLSVVLANAAGGCPRVYVYDEGFVVLAGLPPGELAKQAGLLSARVLVTGAAGGANAKLDVTHLHPSALAAPLRLLDMAAGPPAPGPVRSLGHDVRLGFDFWSAGDRLFYRETAAAGADWRARPFATDAEILERLNQCRPHAGAGQRERSVPAFSAEDLESVKALACLAYDAAMSSWHRHPRYYVQQR